MGKLLIDSINLLDRPVIVAYLLVIVTIFIVINLVVDVLYSVLDPRVRLRGREGLSHGDARRDEDAAATAGRRRAAETPFRRFVARLRRRAGSRCSASRCSSLIIVARAVRRR